MRYQLKFLMSIFEVAHGIELLFKWILAMSLLAACSVASAQTAVITGDDEFEPGRKVILDASESDADSVAWFTSDGIEFEQFDRSICIWASPGRYSVTLVSVKVVDGKALLATAQHTFRITGVTPPDPTPDPPKPDPPGPSPPGPTPPPKPDLTGFAKEAFDNAPRDASPGEIGSVAVVLRGLSTEAAALRWDVDQIKTEFMSRTVRVFTDDAMRQRWTAYNRWQTDTIKANAGSARSLIDLFGAIADGLDAARTSQAQPPTGASGSLRDIMRETRESIESFNREVQREIGQ